jgi:hypothetical protein
VSATVSRIAEREAMGSGAEEGGGAAGENRAEIGRRTLEISAASLAPQAGAQE